MSKEPSEGQLRLDAKMDSLIDTLHFAAPELWKFHLHTLYTYGFEDGVNAVTEAWKQEKARKAIFHLDGDGVIRIVDGIFGTTDDDATDAG